MKKTRFLIFVLIGLIIGLGSFVFYYEWHKLPVQKISPSSNSTGFHLAFFLNTRSSYYNDNLQLLAKNLRDSDYLFIIVNSKLSLADQLVQQARTLCHPGVNVNSVVLYSDLQNIMDKGPSLPRGIDWIIYDYEGGFEFSPEFTTNETVSVGYFDQARNAVEKYNTNTGSNARFMVAPSYVQLRNGNWNWGLAAKHMDGIDIQVQTFLRNQTKLNNYVSSAKDQIIQTSPSTLTLFQLSLLPLTGTPQDAVNAIYYLKDPNINGFLIFYDQSSQNSQLQQFFSLLQR